MMQDKLTQNYPDLKTLSKEGVKLLIFDLDGTLLDSMSVWNDVDVEFLGRYGYEVTPEYTDIVKRASIEDAARYTQTKYRIPLTWQEIVETWESMVYEFYRSEVKAASCEDPCVGIVHILGQFRPIAITRIRVIHQSKREKRKASIFSRLH